MNKIYKSYKQRLISLDSRNSSFFLSRLTSKRHIDLVKVYKQFNKSNFLLEGLEQSNTFTLTRFQINKLELFYILKNLESDFEEKVKATIPIISKIDIENLKEFGKEKHNDEEIETVINEYLFKYDKEYLKIFKQFDRLFKQNRAIERDRGKTDLYLGYPFLEGKFANGKDFRGPLVLHKIQIKNNNNNMQFDILKEGKIINPVFLLSYLNENGGDYKRFNFEIPDNHEDFLGYAIKFLKEQGISVEYINDDLLEIDSITKKEYVKKYYNDINKFKVMKYAVLGIFPVSNRNVYNDLDALDKNPELTSDSLAEFFSGNGLYQDAIVDSAPKEEMIKYISPIDWSQRVVIKRAIEDNLVIEGPPGTGKSQTIVNIIVNLLLKDKKVLIVSEKLAAITVVYNRLNKLRENALLIKDHIKNKNDFYQQILNCEKKMELFIDDKVYNSKVDEIIDRHMYYLKEINNENYVEGFRFDEVLNLSKDITLYQFNDEQKYSISSFIKAHPKDFKRVLNSMIDEKVIDEYKVFKSYEKLNIFNLLSTKEIFFFIDQINHSFSDKQIQFNYHLHKMGKEIIYFSNVVTQHTNEDDRFFNYHGFENYIDKLYERIKKYENNLNELNQSIYIELNKRNKIDLAIKWSLLTEKEKKISIKRIFNEKFKQNLFTKIICKQIKFNEEEQIFFDYLENYSSYFDLDLLKQISHNFLDMDLFIAKYAIKNEIKSKNELIESILLLEHVKFKDSNFDVIIKEMKSSINDVNPQVIKEFSKYNKSDLKMMALYIEFKSKDKFLDSIYKIYIGDDKLKEVQEIYHYFETNNGNIDEIIQSVDEKYRASIDYTYHQMKQNILKRLNNEEVYKSYKLLIGQAELQRRKSVKVIFNRYADALQTIFPIMLMSPDVVSTVYELKPNLFDYVIFDEASQMFIERAIPAIHRANKIVVAGDSKQLKPSSTFTSRLAESDEIDDDYSISNAELEALDKESLLDLSKSKYITKMLQFHYRSEHEELVEFSSAAFYNKKLFFASKISGTKWKKPIEVIKVNQGIWTSENTNPKEADVVVKLVKKILNHRKLNETIGIITFNVKQKNYIQELLDESDDTNIINELERVNKTTGEDESLFVKNIENVQGDERDIIIFSIGYAYNEQGRLRASFGLLNQSGGANRLNVAITRAKKKIYVVKSIEANELRVNEKNEGPLRLKQYLEFVEYVDQKRIEDKNKLINQIFNPNQIYEDKLEQFDSEFEIEVYDKLLEIIPPNIIVKNQFKVGGYYIDLVLYDVKNEKFILGIECDGYRWHSTPEQIERDFYRQQYLEERGWSIYRILSTNWWNKQHEEIRKLSNVINNLK